jgi:ketosteroid isomerase-like protein
MKASILLLLACLAVVVLAENRRDANAIKEEIIDFERARLAAFAKADKPEFDRMMADDATVTHSSGGVSSKADLMEVMRPSTPDQPLPALTIEEPKAQLYGDAAVLTGKLVETAADGRRELVLRFTNTYVKQEAHWKMVAGQLTALSREKAPTNVNPQTSPAPTKSPSP